MDIMNTSVSSEVTKEDVLNNYFTAIGTDLIENNKLQDMCIGNKARQYARFLTNEIPNLINTDCLSLVMLCQLLQDVNFMEKQLQEARENKNLVVYSKLMKLKLDAISKSNTLLTEFGLTAKSRKSILALDFEELEE